MTKPDSSTTLPPTRPPARPPVRKRRRFNPVFWIGTLALAGLLYVGFWPKPILVETAQAIRGPMTVSVFEEGKTRIRHRYTISSPVAGFLRRVPLRAGAKIVKGETVLALIDAEPTGFLNPRAQAQAQAALKAAKAALELRQAELARAHAMEELAKKELARFQRLLEQKATSLQGWENAANTAEVRAREVSAATFAVEVARFEVAQAEAGLIENRPTESQPLEIRAPIDGFVLNVAEESARPIAPGQPILEVGDPRDLEAEIELLSRDAVNVRPGTPVTIEQWGGEEPLNGKVVLIERGGFTKISALGVEEQRVRVRVDFDQRPPGEVLGDRYRVEARIAIWQGDNVLQIPTGALFRHGEAWVTFVVKLGHVQRREITVARHNGQMAQVLSGLEEGETVVVYPPETLAEGHAVHSEPSKILK